MMWDRWVGWSPFFWIMPLVMLFFWILVIIAVVFLIKWLIESSKKLPGETPVSQNPIDILKQRYAKGEITKEQFEQMKKDLQ